MRRRSPSLKRPFDFDVSVKDIYSGLFTGARVEIVPTAYFTNPTKLMDFLCDRGVTLMVWAVSALCFLTTMNALAYKTPTTLRAILFSGEIMPIKHLHKLQKYLPEYNTYLPRNAQNQILQKPGSGRRSPALFLQYLLPLPP